MKGAWVPHDIRDEIVDYVNHWTERTELPARRLLGWLGLGTSKFHDWKHRYGKVNEHNGMVPHDWWLEDWEKRARTPWLAQCWFAKGVSSRKVGTSARAGHMRKYLRCAVRRRGARRCT